LLGLIAAAAMGLATDGVFAVLLNTVAGRRPHNPVRMAVGARTRHVLRAVVGEGLAMAVVGLSLGALAALGLTRHLDSVLYEVSPTDPSAFAAAGAGLAAAVLLASWLPARRALRVDPAAILRSE
jgi:putative ABC transport system permease protein